MGKNKNPFTYGKEEKVRLIGIDTPESHPNQRAVRESERTGDDMDTITRMGKRTTRFVEELVKSGDRVSIEFDVEKRNRYGRLLGYVYLPDGSMLNEEIVKAGYASPLTVPPNVKYKDRRHIEMRGKISAAYGGNKPST